jgi:hypothetical protein
MAGDPTNRAHNMNTPKVAADVAEAEFARFVESMDLDVDTSRMNDEDRQSFEQQKTRIVRAMMDGRVVINERGEPVFYPTSGKPSELVFHEPEGAALMAMDNRKKGHDVSKMFAVMAEQTKVPSAVFASMPMRDLKIVQAIATLFLA